jgi:hypothetical protein
LDVIKKLEDRTTVAKFYIQIIKLKQTGKLLNQKQIENYHWIFFSSEGNSTNNHQVTADTFNNHFLSVGDKINTNSIHVNSISDEPLSNYDSSDEENGNNNNSNIINNF